MNRTSTVFLNYVAQWAALAPLLLVYFVGIAVALVKAREFRVPAVLVLFAMLLLGAVALVGPVGTTYLVSQAGPQGWTRAQVGYAMSAFHGTVAFVQAIGTALMLAAAFHRRGAVPVVVPPLPVSPPPLP